MLQAKQQLISFLKKYPLINSYFGEMYLENIITYYESSSDKSMKKQSSPLSHMIMVNYCVEHIEFFVEMERMLNFFYSNGHLKEYILYPRVKNMLKSQNNSDFQSKWTELIFAYFLSRNSFNVLKIGQSNGESIEESDILTDKGSFEVTTVISKNDRYPEGVFFGDNNISDDSIEIINRKIKAKRKQNKATSIVIDCTFMDDYTDKLFTSNALKLPVDYKVFKPAGKRVVTFIRNNVTQQVGLNQQIEFE